MSKWVLFKMLGGSNAKQWTRLQHNGPMFPNEYKPHKIPVTINNNKVILPEQAEEYATMYARFIGTDYMNSSLFKKNFWKDFKPTLTNIDSNKLKSMTIDEIDFSSIKIHLDNEKEKKKNMTDDEKKRIKIKQTEIEEPYQNCIIDGAQQKIGNYKK